MNFELPKLPVACDLETKPVLKKLSSAHRCLAELKGISGTIPNQAILLNTLSFQEAKDSSAIENIITSHDELFKACRKLRNRQGTRSEATLFLASRSGAVGSQ